MRAVLEPAAGAPVRHPEKSGDQEPFEIPLPAAPSPVPAILTLIVAALVVGTLATW